MILLRGINREPSYHVTMVQCPLYQERCWNIRPDWKPLTRLLPKLAQDNTTRSWLLSVLLVVVLLLCLAAYSSWRAVPGWIPPLPLPVAALAWRNLLKSRRDALEASRLQEFYQSGVDRMEGRWAGKGTSGEEFRRTDHLYGQDLNLFGAGSMFELLCTTRSQVGQRWLASYLLDLPDRNETLARQEAVKELHPLSDLRERICLLGQYTFQSCEWEPFIEWLDSPVVPVAGAIRWILPAVSSALVLLILIPWLAAPGAGLWTLAAPFLAALIPVQIGLAFLLRPRVRPVLDRNRRIGHEINLFWQGLALLETQSFRSAKLKELAERVKGASVEVRKLDRLIQAAVVQCNKEWFYGPSTHAACGYSARDGHRAMESLARRESSSLAGRLGRV
jgi:hypothetical protein